MLMMKKLIFDESGQGLTEYGLVLGIISIGAITLIGTLREDIILLFSKATGIVTKNNELTSP